MKQANPINITHIDHVVIRVNDLENMIAFYRDVLGCKLERGPGEGGLAQLRAGHSLIDLVDANGPFRKIRVSCVIQKVRYCAFSCAV